MSSFDSANVLGVPASDDKCLESRQIVRGFLNFTDVGDTIELTLDGQVTAQNIAKLSVVKGLVVLLRARTDTVTSLNPWMRIVVNTIQQTFDMAAATSITPWFSMYLSLPIFTPATGKISFTWKQGQLPLLNDAVVIVTNFEVEPMFTCVNTSDEVG